MSVYRRANASTGVRERMHGLGASRVEPVGARGLLYKFGSVNYVYESRPLAPQATDGLPRLSIYSGQYRLRKGQGRRCSRSWDRNEAQPL